MSQVASSDEKRAFLDEVAAELDLRVDSDEVAEIHEFIERAFAVVPADVLVERPSATVAGAVHNLWQLGQRRRPGEVRMRLYHPIEERDGWESPHTVVDIVNDDMPFLLASINGELNRRDRRLHRVFHPVLDVERGPGGDFEAIDENGRPESWIHLEIDRETLGQEGLDDLEERLRSVLGKVRVTVEDWRPMQEKTREIVARLERESLPVPDGEADEAIAFLRWLLDDHFTFLGYRRYSLVERGDEHFLELDPESGLGLLSEVTEGSRRRSATPLPENLVEFLRRPEVLIITKSSRRSPVHRPVHMDIVGIRRFDDAGDVIGEDRLLGLFTSAVYTAATTSIPVLRRKVRRTMERADLKVGSHDSKALAHILESFPRDELFQITEDDLSRIALGVIQVKQRRQVALFVRRDEFQRFVSCLVYVPRDRYTSELRGRLQKILERAFGGTVTAFYTQVADAPMARIHYVVKTVPQQIPDVDVKRVERQLREATRSWRDHLREHLVEEYDAERGLRLLESYGEAFPRTYREVVPAKRAIPDIEAVERLLAEGRGFDVRLYRPEHYSPDCVRLKLYRRGEHIALSDALPILENMGVVVESELPNEVTPAECEVPIWVHDFDLRSRDDEEIELERIDAEFEETLRRVWCGDLENGVLNRLVLACGLAWEEIVVLRAYSRYLRQLGITFSQRYMAQTLVSNSVVASSLVELFGLLFDPDEQRDGDTEVRRDHEGLLREIRDRLEDVQSLDQDRILRGFLSVITGTVRTNHFQRTAHGERKPYLAVKLDCGEVREMPEPRPHYEIFVYSPRMEGVHLRGGLVARGGIRWSDRREDFRTEILGLMKAQRVKNAVIVPVGAKGGFVVKQPPDGARESVVEEGIECYKAFIRGLLDLTDDLDGDRVVPPPATVRRDGDDPYLVIAADKGTAGFSDIANNVARGYDFWLGDAFASGGSAGYDHKEMGITARGAWEAVKRHFRELGRNIQSEPFTVVGVGDMSGDVFGNGMLLSRQTRLVGAFDHEHVFVDPAPSPTSSYAERQRLFEKGRSSWDDYDRGCISAGGGVFERDVKSIEVTAEMRERFDLGTAESITSAELIRALLTAEVDLLWFGGIGTFVKSSTERHMDVGDRTNDTVRVDGVELRAKVVGEGANLAMTQRGRVEYALAGGRLNTDAIDNSGGVDLSDHEVNIKIALGDAVAEGRLTLEERNRLLEQMSEEVGDLVLRDNYLQSQALTLARARAGELRDHHSRMMHELERRGILDRSIEALPDDETLAERALGGEGMTRPELAVLLAYAKISLYDELIDTDLPDDSLLVGDLLRYFPQPLREDFASDLEEHRLRREIIVTYVVNSMVNRVGPTFVFRMRDASGREARDVARAYTIARDAFDLRTIWSGVEKLDTRVDAEVQTEMLLEAGRLVEHTALWFLQRHPASLDVASVVRRFRPGLRRLARELEPLLPSSARRDVRKRARRYGAEGAPEKLASRVAALRGLAAGPDIVQLAMESDREVDQVAHIYFGLGDRFGLYWLRSSANELAADSTWDQAAIEALVKDLYGHQSAMTRQVLAGADGADWRRAVDEWMAARNGPARQALRVIDELRGSGGFDLARLTVADRQIARLADR